MRWTKNLPKLAHSKVRHLVWKHLLKKIEILKIDFGPERDLFLKKVGELMEKTGEARGIKVNFHGL